MEIKNSLAWIWAEGRYYSGLGGYLAALDDYSKENHHLNLGWVDSLGMEIGKKLEENTSFFHGVLQTNGEV